MTQFTFGKDTKFFRSFTATAMPVVPIDEIGSADDIDNHVSFYAADFDDCGRLIRCRKFLNVEDEEKSGPKLVFDDQYTYSAAGSLESRTLIRADDNESRWFFDTWSACESWREFSLAQDELTEIESRAMSSVWTSDIRGNEFAVASVQQYLTSAEQVLRAATHDPAATIGMLIPRNKDEWISLHPSSGIISDDIRCVLMPNMLNCELPFVCATASELSEALPEGNRVFADNQIRALAAQPVRVKDEETTTIGVIAMLARRDLAERTAGPTMSLLKRVAVFVELLVELGLREDPIRRSPQAGTSQQE